MTMRREILSLVIIGAIFTLSAWGQEPSVEEMKKRADEVLKMDNITARSHIEDVMRLADQLAKDGNLAEAVRYYEAGLRHFPLDLKRQLACAELYMKLGKKDEALAKAKIVAKVAEEDALLVPARKMLGEKVNTEIEPIGKLDGNAFTIVLVPMGEVDVLLLQDIRQKVQDQLGIPVLIRTVPLKMPDFGRDPLHDLCESLRKHLRRMQEDSPDEFSTMLNGAGVQEADLAQDPVVLKLQQWLVNQPGNEAGKQAFTQALQKLPSYEKQWNSSDLLKVIVDVTKPYQQKNVRFLGVTRCDIYSEKTAFLFANSYMGQISVMSYRRFMSASTRETPNRDRLLKRSVNQALSSCGKVFGIDACSDPTCPRAYPHSVAEQDAKGEKLCDQCLKAFDEAFGRKRPSPPVPVAPAKS
jgi:predicted Zn-dependent protease